MEQQGASLDLPLITEATNEFYRQVYGNSDLAPIFKGYNMVVLRRHVCYFILQLSAFDTPLSEPQIEYLRKVHAPVIEERGATQRHFDIVASLLVTSLRAAGAQACQHSSCRGSSRPAPCSSSSSSSSSSGSGRHSSVSSARSSLWQAVTDALSCSVACQHSSCRGSSRPAPCSSSSSSSSSSHSKFLLQHLHRLQSRLHSGSSRTSIGDWSSNCSSCQLAVQQQSKLCQ
eukprot:jgi/Sobl393_1/51/SZX74790.1